MNISSYYCYHYLHRLLSPNTDNNLGDPSKWPGVRCISQLFCLCLRPESNPWLVCRQAGELCLTLLPRSGLLCTILLLVPVSLWQSFLAAGGELQECPSRGPAPVDTLLSSQWLECITWTGWESAGKEVSWALKRGTTKWMFATRSPRYHTEKVFFVSVF